MASRIKSQILFICLIAFCISLLFPNPVRAAESNTNLPSLHAFTKSIENGEATTLRGIYVQEKFAFEIIQQPMGYPGYVAEKASTVTQFSIASEVGNIGLLAHNYLAGANFYQLKKGDRIFLIYGNGHTQSFIVTEIVQYQATMPLSPYSHFKGIGTNEFLSAEQLFNKVYRGDFHLTLQTCLEKDGNQSWGRSFIIAKPIPNKSISFKAKSE